MSQTQGPPEIRTFLIADVRGYTRFTQERGDEAAAKLAAKFAQVARAGIEARDGVLIELRGDEALAVFSSPRQALRAATELQLRFVEETVADPSLPMPVGIGLDAGEAVAVEGGYRGGALNLAARLCGQARAGQVLVSREIVHLARKVEGLRYVDRGAVHLKNLDEPVRIVAVLPEEGDDPATYFATIASLEPKAVPTPRRLAGARRLFPNGLRSRRGLALGLAVLVIAAGIPYLLTRGSLPPGLPGIESDAVGIIDLHAKRIVAQVRIGSRPGAVAFGHDAVWVANEAAGTVSRIDPETRAVVDSIEVGKDPVAIAVSDDSVWVANGSDGTVTRISPEDDDRVVRTIPTGNGPAGLAVGGGSVWVTNLLDGTLSRIDPKTNTATRVDAGANPSTVAAAGAVWVTNSTAGTVSRLDLGSATAVGSPVHVGNGPTAVVAADDDVWVANEPDGTVSRIDAATGTVAATVPVGRGPVAIALVRDSVWVADGVDGSIVRIDGDSNTVVDTIDVGSSPSGLANVEDRELWVTTRAAASAHRGGTLTLVALSNPQVDPHVGYDPVSWAILNVMNDGLVGFRQTGGPAGATVIPNLAFSVPEPTDGGRTYTFQLRSGVRYSTGLELKAEDVLASFERFFEAHAAPPFFDHIVGAQACIEDPAGCDLSKGIETNDGAATVTFHLTGPDPEFLLKLAMPFGDILPSGTPIPKGDTAQPVPATGPYMVASSQPNRIELVRNPHFVEWSHTAKPDGYPDRIAIESGQDPDELLGRVDGGQADSFLDFVPDRAPPDLATRFAGRMHPYALARLTYLFMRSREPPFDDVRVRKALNFAIDRSRMAEIFGGPLVQRPTCQVLPPNFQGYEPYCPYTLDPSAGGGWTAPDLDTARQLVRMSGTEGMRITLAYPPFWPKEGRGYLTSLLEDLGYRVTLTTGGKDYFGLISDSASDVQVGGSQWGADYPAASQFINVLLSCAAFVAKDPGNLNASQFCDPDIDSDISQALDLQVIDQSASGTLWAEIDHALVDAAAIVPLFNRQGIDLLSERVGDYQHHPLYGLLISQLWVQ